MRKLSWPIRLYKIFLSPYLGHSCRFMPTCSEYADEAFKKHNFFKALYLTIKRIIKCGPWGPSGIDNVP